MKLTTILTIRSDSERYPNKCLAHINKKPLVHWLVKRLQKLPGNLVLATTDDKTDDKLARIVEKLSVPVWRDSEDVNDVVGRMSRVIKAWYPETEYVFRALGDCPFIETDFIERAVRIMEYRKAECFLWHLPPYSWPVYGAREFPMSRIAFNRIDRYARARLGEREHGDLFLNRNRHEFRFVYHEPPNPLLYIRPYRLEVDYPEDVKMIRKIAKKVGMLAPLSEVIRFLDANPEIAEINRECVEKTGPQSSYNNAIYRSWLKEMRNKPMISWDDKLWQGPEKSGTREVFCNAGHCLVGWGCRGLLYSVDGAVIEAGRVSCRCGAGRVWEKS